MSRKLPIRTYQRKNIKNPLIQICNSIQMNLILNPDNISEERREIVNIVENEVNDNSLDCDPFETTFDRIAKDAIVPPIPFDCIGNKSWYDSSFDTSNEKKEEKELLFDVSIGAPNITVSSSKKYERFWEKMPYEKKKKEKIKKTHNTKTLSKSKYPRQLTTLKKENHVKVYQKKRKLRKVTDKKENKSSNTDSLYSASNSRSDKLYKQHTIGSGTIEVTNSENINSIDIFPNTDIYKENVDLSNSNKFKQHDPLRETTNILNIYDRKETCPLKFINKIQVLNNKDNQNYSSKSSESQEVPYLTEDFKIKSCSVILNKDSIEKGRLMVKKSQNIVKEGNRVLDKISNSTLNNSVNSTYKTSKNDSYLKENPMCSTPISTYKKTSACSILYSPINIASSMSCIAYNTNESILHTKADITNDINVSVDQVQLTDLPILNRTFINNSMTAKLCTKDMVSYEGNTKVQKSTSVDHLLNSKNNKVYLQEQNMSLPETSESNSNFINNRERYDTIFMDDSIGIAFRQECGKKHEKSNSLLNYLNTSVETNRSYSLFNDSESNLYTVASDDNMGSTNHKSLINMNVSKSNADSKLELEFSVLDTCDDKEIPKLGVQKTTTEEKLTEKCIENENQNVEEKNYGGLYVNQNHCDVNATNALFVTNRKPKNWKKNFYLSDIHENDDIVQYPTSEILQHNEKVSDHSLSQNSTKNLVNNSVNTVTHCDEQNSWLNRHASSLSEKFIFLKPGKFWTRSLSILHNFQNGLHLNEVSVEKGRKWRHSVKDILDMQKKDLASSYMEKNIYMDKLQLFNKTQVKSCDQLTRTYHKDQLAHFKQFTRRNSVRVVRDSRCIQNIDDTSFHEVYGLSINTKPESTILEGSITKYNTLYNDENNHLELFSSKTAKEVVLQRCSQEDYLPFREYVSNTFLKYCRKIGEGVYGEVFLYERDKQKSVLKIIPIEGDQLINGEPQKRFNEILSEIVIAKELHNLRWSGIHSTSGFVEVKSIKCIKGKYPEELIHLWKNYDNEKTSDNDCPSVFDENQLYIAFELGHGGQDLESFEFHTAFEAHTLFIQIALALAVAERSFKFEHRDLHWGNILISYTDEQHIYYKLDNKDIFFPSNGIKGCIIDFTLSRMSYQGCCIFNDLSVDPDLFIAQGEYQFEIYRLMRDKIHNNWQEYEPYTNILWLHYILDKMVTIVRYKKKNLKKHKNAIIKLQNLKQVILLYKSAFDFVNSCEQIVNSLQNISA